MVKIDIFFGGYGYDSHYEIELFNSTQLFGNSFRVKLSLIQFI